MKEQEAKAYAKKVFTERQEKVKKLEEEKEFRVYCQVNNIIKIFEKATEAEEASISIWEVCLIRSSENEKNVSVAAVEKATGLYIDIDRLPEKGLKEVAEAIKNVIIPKELFWDIRDYFGENLSDYFETTTDIAECRIALKNPICEREESEE